MHCREKRRTNHQNVDRASLDGGIILDFGGGWILHGFLGWVGWFGYFPNSLVASLEMENSHWSHPSSSCSLHFYPHKNTCAFTYNPHSPTSGKGKGEKEKHPAGGGEVNPWRTRLQRQSREVSVLPGVQHRSSQHCTDSPLK